jgi:hypothetical protein
LAVDDRWAGEFRYRAWGNGVWWIPLPDGWLSSCDGIYRWAGPFADVNGPAPDGTNPGGPVPAEAAVAAPPDLDQNRERSNIMVGVPEVLYRIQALDKPETEFEAMEAVYDYFLSGHLNQTAVEDFVIQYMQHGFRFQTSFTVLLSVANLDEKIPSYDKYIEYCYARAAADEIAHEDVVKLIEHFRTTDFAENAARPACLRIESYMQPPEPPPRPEPRSLPEQFIPPFT